MTNLPAEIALRQDTAAGQQPVSIALDDWHRLRAAFSNSDEQADPAETGAADHFLVLETGSKLQFAIDWKTVVSPGKEVPMRMASVWSNNHRRVTAATISKVISSPAA
jgi:hypothetical protein